MRIARPKIKILQGRRAEICILCVAGLRTTFPKGCGFRSAWLGWLSAGFVVAGECSLLDPFPLKTRYFSAIAPEFCRSIVFTQELVEGVGSCATRP